MQKSDNIFSNHILITAETEEVKKNGGKKKGSVAKVIALISVIEDLQSKIEDCIESQDDPDIVAKIESFDKHVDDMLKALTDITTASIQGLRKRTKDGEQDLALAEGSTKDPAPLKPSVVVSPSLPVRP